MWADAGRVMPRGSAPILAFRWLMNSATSQKVRIQKLDFHQKRWRRGGGHTGRL